MSEIAIVTLDAVDFIADVTNPPGKQLTTTGRFWWAFDDGDAEILYSKRFWYPTWPTGTKKCRIECYSHTQTASTVLFNVYMEALSHGDAVSMVSGESWGTANPIDGALAGTIDFPTIFADAFAYLDSGAEGDSCRLKVMRSDAVSDDVYFGGLELYVDQS